MNTRIIPCQVNNEYIKGAGVPVGAAGSHNDVVLEIAFSALWDGLAKKITWLDANGENPTLTILTTNMLKDGETAVYLVPIPAEPKAYAGDMTMTIKGLTVSGDTETRATLTTSCTFRVLPSAYDNEADESADVTPTQAAQLQAEIDTILSTITNAAASATAAATSETAAAASATGAAASRTAAEAAQSAAETAQSAAETAKTNAETAETNAETAQEAAETAKADAVTEKTAAETAKANAETAKTAAEAAKADTLTYKAAAESAKAAAETAETNAETAQGAAEAAQGAAETAQAAAEAAQTAAETAEGNALTYKGDAETAKTAAEAAQAAAETAQGAAASSKTDAETAAGTATTKADEASASAAAALTSQQAAAGSAASALDSAASATGSATDAAESQEAAAASESAAADSAADAAADAILSESWAVGGTNTRAGENTNNAKYWSDAAQAAAGGGVSAFNGRSGAVAPQAGDYNASMVGADASGTAAAHNAAADAHASLFAGKSDTGHTHDDRYYTETETNTLLAAKAASSHAHAATDITSGTLPLTRGGTGQTTAQAAATALGRGYGTSSTAAATAVKVGTLSGFVRQTGAVVGVKFTYVNTATAPVLDVNSTGAAAIRDFRTNAAPAAGDMGNGVHLFQFDGTYWVLLNPLVLKLLPRIVATAPTGSTVTCTKGGTILTATEVSGTWTFDLPDYGTWTVDASKSGDSASSSVIVDTVKQYNVSLAYYHVYGVLWDGTSTTALSRTDEAELFTNPTPAVSNGNGSSPFDSLQPWAGMVKSSRTGGVMVSIPKFWFKWTKSGNTLKLQIADKAAPGFSVSPAHMDRGDGTGERDIVYVGRHHCNSSYLSGTGSPVASITRSSARSSIHAKGTKIWQMDYAMRLTIQMLYLVEYADWNSQAKIGYGCGNNSAAQAMGYTDSMTYHTGTTQASRTTYGLGTQYRWIEGLWDNVYDWMDGCYYNSNGLNIIKNPSNFSDSANGTAVGTPSNGYSSVMSISAISGFEWVMFPTTASGSGSTYVPDGWYFNSSSPCLRVGGSYGQDQNHGLFFVSCDGTSSANADIGCRLQELP